MGARLNTFRAMFPEQKNKRRDETKKCTQFHPIWIFLFEVYGAALGMNFLLSGFMNIMLFPPNMPYNVNVDKQSDSRQIHNCFFANFTRAYLAFFYSHSYSKLIHYSIIFHPLLLPIVLYLYLSRGFSFLGLFCHYSLHLSCPAHTLSALSHVSFSVPLPHFETLARCRELYISLNIHCQFITTYPSTFSTPVAPILITARHHYSVTHQFLYRRKSTQKNIYAKSKRCYGTHYSMPYQFNLVKSFLFYQYNMKRLILSFSALYVNRSKSIFSIFE